MLNQLGSPDKWKGELECVTDKRSSSSQDVLALSGGLALAPPLISSVAFTRGTSWSSSRNTLRPLSKTTCRPTAELRVFLTKRKQTVCVESETLSTAMLEMTLLTPRDFACCINRAEQLALVLGCAVAY